MPKTKVIIYQNEDGSVPLIEWLKKQPQKAQDKCTAMIELLAAVATSLGVHMLIILTRGFMSFGQQLNAYITEYYTAL